MSQLIDRRLNISKKSMVNRQRFLSRYKAQIKKAVLRSMSQKSMTDFDKGEAVSIPKKDLSEPHFQRGQGGVVDRVLPGNRSFTTGDEIQKPKQTSTDGGGSGASNEGENEDAFVFKLSREEFLELYFEDLALPALIKKELGLMEDVKTVRSGFVTSGPAMNINVVRSMRQAAGRRRALGASHRKKLEAEKKALSELEASAKPEEEKAFLREELLKKIAGYERKVGAIPFIDDIDLRYNHRIKISAPITKAVMFCIMDVSGSMDEAKKELAKQFFVLLYLFLTKNYQNIELVFIRHHTSAKEVDEKTFFYARETGGTVVSSALELLIRLIQERYAPHAWNIYVAQASDGDNWNADSPYCQSLLMEKIMPWVQYFAYVEIMPRHHQSLWEAYSFVKASYPNFAMQHIDKPEAIYPVFRMLFQKERL